MYSKYLNFPYLLNKYSFEEKPGINKYNIIIYDKFKKQYPLRYTENNIVKINYSKINEDYEDNFYSEPISNVSYIQFRDSFCKYKDIYYRYYNVYLFKGGCYNYDFYDYKDKPPLKSYEFVNYIYLLKKNKTIVFKHDFINIDFKIRWKTIVFLENIENIEKSNDNTYIIITLKNKKIIYVKGDFNLSNWKLLYEVKK